MTEAEFDQMMRSLTGTAALRPRSPKSLPALPRIAPAPASSGTVIELQGGGKVEGRVTRELSSAVVVETAGATVIVLRSARAK